MRSTIVPVGTRQVRAAEEHAREVAHGRRALGRRADHEAGRVAQEQHRQLERVAQLHEARRLVGAVGVDRAAEMGGVVGDHPQRTAVDARERGDHPRAEAVAQLEHRVLVEQRLDDAAHVVDALALLGDQLAQQLLVGHRAGLGARR